MCITVADGSVNSFISYSMPTFLHAQSDSLSVSLSVCLSPAADVGLFLKLRLIRYCAVFHYCFRPTVLSSFSTYCLLHRENQTTIPESVAVTHTPLELVRAYLCLWNTLRWVQMHFSGSADDRKGPVMNRKAKSQHYMLSVKSDGYEKEYRHWLDQS